MKRNSLAPQRIYNGRSWFAILDENAEAIPCDLLTWAKWFSTRGQRILLQDKIDRFTVSTVFIGCMHWYKTIILDPTDEVIWRRHADSKAHAIAAHGNGKSLVITGNLRDTMKEPHA